MAMPKQEFVISAQDKSLAAFNSVKKSLSDIDSAASSFSNTFAALAPLLGAATFTGFLKNGIDTLDMLGDLSDRTGVAATTLSGFQLVAKQSDTSLEALGTGLNKLSLFMANNADAAKKLGITASDPAEAFIQLASVLEKTASVQERNAIANQVLGKSYAELLPTLNQGADALRAQIKEGQALSNVTEESVQQAQKFNDELDKLKLQASNLGQTFAIDLLPSFTDIIGAMKLASQEGSGLYTLFIGLGGLADLAFNGTKINQAKNAITDLNAEIKTLSVRKTELDKGDAILDLIYGKDKNQNRLNQAKQELINAQNELQKLTNPPKPAEKQNNNASILAALDAEKAAKEKLDAANKKAQSTSEASAKAAQAFTEKLTQQVSLLGATKSASIEYEAAQLNLSASQKESFKNSIAKIDAYERELEAVKELADFQKLLQESDNRDLSALEEQSQLEQQMQATREADYQSFYDNLTRLNEDLNIELLTNDKKRARAQIDLENERAIERINAMGLEADEVAALIEKQTENYQLQINKIEQSSKNTKNIGKELGLTFTSAFEDAAVAGADFGDVLNGLGEDLARLALRKSVTEPLSGAFSNLFSDFNFGSLFANANGGVYSGSGISSFSGQIVSKPTLFPFAKGTGLMGEAGPEAIMPLKRGKDGKLGIEGAGQSVVVNVINNANGTRATATENSDNGMRVIDVLIEQVKDAIAGDINRGSGSIPSTMERKYGLNPAVGAMR